MEKQILNADSVYRQSYRQETEIKVVCTGILPVANIIVEIKEEPVIPQQIEYKDRYIVCKDCGRKFLFSAKEQEHFDKMDWDEAIQSR